MIHNLKVGQVYEFEVLPRGRHDDDFFYLNLGAGIEPAKLKKLKFQRQEELPKRLHCKVKGFDNGVPILDHYFPRYVKRFYGDAVRRHQSFYFTVVGVPTNHSDPICLTDDYGIIYRVHEPKAMVAVSQQVCCEFEVINDSRFQLRISDEKMQLCFMTPEALFAELGVRPIVARLITRYLCALPAMAIALDELADSNPRWIITALHTIEQHLSDWFVALDAKRRPQLVRTLIDTYRRTGLYLLEGSNFMSNVTGKRRDNMRVRLTDLVESAEPLRQTLKLLTDGAGQAYVDTIMDKLNKSGYLYHPTLQLSVMMLIFRLNPGIVDDSLSRIFEVIMSRDLDTWSEEPFVSAFIDQFEVYLTHCRKQISALPLADTPREKHTIETAITAMALQLLMADPDKFPAYLRNQSLFYRCVALLQPFKSDDLLTKSLLTALGMSMPLNFSYENIRTPMMMMTKASVMPAGGGLQSLTSGRTYHGDRFSLALGPGGLSLSTNDRFSARQQVIPAGMMLWATPQIFCDSIDAPRDNSIAAHYTWWRQVENELTRDPEHRQGVRIEKTRPNPGDWVTIRINSVINRQDGNPVMRCVVHDRNFEAVEGTLKRDEVIGYKVSNISPDTFISPSGVHYDYMALVKSIDPDGNYQFSMLDEVRDWLEEDVYSFSREYRGVITGKTARGYSALCEDGFGLYLDINPDEPPYNATDKVTFRLSETSRGMVRGYITGELPIETRIDKNLAFANVMSSVAIEPEHAELVEAKAAEPENTLPEEPLTVEDVAEIIEVLRFRAVSARKIVESYDYLSFARLAALAAGLTDEAAALAIHAELLQLTEYFATNNTVDTEALERLRPLCPAGTILGRFFGRLELLAALGDGENSPVLARAVADSDHELEQQVARLVTACNILRAAGVDSDDTMQQILASIKRLLNVDDDTTPLKYYGSETRYVEFKSSTVYPPVKPGQPSVADPARMQNILLKVIASFMNADGGTLYIGVGDSHYECGLHDDFEYYRRNKFKCGPYEDRVKNLDGLCVALTNLVNLTFRDSVSRLVEISPDDDASKDVIVVKVKRSLDPVDLDGNWYERKSSSVCQIVIPEEIERFKAERQALREAR